MPEDPKVKDIMSHNVTSCKPNATVAEAALRMKEDDVGSIVVVEGKRPIGIATREDITNKIAALDKKPSEIMIKDIMSIPLVTVSPDETLSDVAKKMNKHGFERLPVKYMDKLVGFVSVRDILRVSPGMLDIMKERLKIEAPSFGESTTPGECELCGNFQEQLHHINDRWVCDTCKEEAAEI